DGRRCHNNVIIFRGDNMVKTALFVRLEAKPGKEAEVEGFLRGGLPIVEEEPATVAWFGIRLGQTTFGIFDAFPDEAGRQAHLSGKISAGSRGSRRVPGNYSLAACDPQKLARWAVAVATVCASIGCHQSREDAHAREVATRVRSEFLHAWTNYEKYAWGHDALKPLSK